MADFSDFIDLANELISENGMEMTYVAIAEYGKIDPDTGKKPVTIEEKKVIGVKTGPTKSELERGYFQGIKLIALVAGDKLEKPDTTDVLQFDGHDYDIKEIVKVNPAEQVILYKFGLVDAGTIGMSTRLRRRT